MAACAYDLPSARKPPGPTTATRRLIDAENMERRVRSIQYWMRIAKFPHHEEFATFDHDTAAVSRSRIDPFRTRRFTREAHDIILVGVTGDGPLAVDYAATCGKSRIAPRAPRWPASVTILRPVHLSSLPRGMAASRACSIKWRARNGPSPASCAPEPAASGHPTETGVRSRTGSPPGISEMFTTRVDKRGIFFISQIRKEEQPINVIRRQTDRKLVR